MAERLKRPAVAWKLERLLDVGSEAALSRSVDVVSRITLGAVDTKRKRRRGAVLVTVPLLELVWTCSTCF